MLVKYDCKDLPTCASEQVWHHPSIARAYFPLIMYFRASRVPRVTHPGRSLVTPGGYTLQYNEEIRVHYWRMLSLHGQMHPLEGLYYHSWQMGPLHSVVQRSLSIWVVYDLLTHIWHFVQYELLSHICQKWLGGRIQWVVGSRLSSMIVKTFQLVHLTTFDTIHQ